MPGAATERRSGLAAVLDELERVGDVVAHSEAEVGRRGYDTADAYRGKHRDERSDDLLVGCAGAQCCVHGIHVGGRGRVHGDQRTDPDQRV